MSATPHGSTRKRFARALAPGAEEPMQTLPFASDVLASDVRVPNSRARRGLREHSIPIPLLRRFQTGDVLADKYRLEGLIGEGSMGEVWRAENIALEMPVAVKFLRRSGIDGTSPLDLLAEVASKHLVLEARATAKLVHPGIVRTLDFGTDRGYPFLVLEYLRGEDLRERLLRDGRMPEVEAAQLLLPVIGAVDFAHAHGIVHKDLKPENVFLTTDDAGRLRPKVLDFGLSVLETHKHGLVAGTPAYMPPEQLAGGPTDLRVDVYAASVMLLELIVGQRPSDAPPPSISREEGFFAGNATSALDVLWGAGADLVSPELANVLVRGLSPKPADRFPSLRALGQAIATHLVDRGIDDDAVGMSLRSHWLATDAFDFALEIPVEVVAAAPEVVTAPEASPVPAVLGAPRAPYFYDDPIVVPKRRSWAALGALGAIIAATAVTVSMATGVTSVDAFRARVVAPLMSHTPPQSALAAGDTPTPTTTDAPADADLNVANDGKVIATQGPTDHASATREPASSDAASLAANPTSSTSPPSAATDALNITAAKRLASRRAKHSTAPAPTIAAPALTAAAIPEPSDDDLAPALDAGEIYVEPKSEPAHDDSYDPSSI